jgi:hypothetical protein
MANEEGTIHISLESICNYLSIIAVNIALKGDSDYKDMPVSQEDAQ